MPNIRIPCCHPSGLAETEDSGSYAFSNASDSNGRSEEIELHIPFRSVGIGHSGCNNIVTRAIVEAAARKWDVQSEASSCRRTMSRVLEVIVMYESAQLSRSRGRVS